MQTQLECAKATETNDNVKKGDTVKLISEGEPPVKTTTKYRKKRSALCRNIPNKMFMNRHETPGVPHSDPSTKSVKNKPQPNEDSTLMTPKLSLDIAGMETQPECAKTTETNNNDKESDTEKLISNGELAVNILAPFLQESASAVSSDIQVSESNLKKVDEPILQSKLHTTDATSKGGSSLQLFKNTFQRKRKREIVSISDGDVSDGNWTFFT